MLRPARAVCLFASLFLILTTLALNAASRGAFQGYYNFRQVNMSGDQVSLTLDIKILNRTGGDVSNATISVRSAAASNSTYGSFAMAFLGSTADLSESLTIPRTEFEHWQTGSGPLFFVSYADVSGKLVQQRLELIRRPLKGGN